MITLQIFSNTNILADMYLYNTHAFDTCAARDSVLIIQDTLVPIRRYYCNITVFQFISLHK